MKTKIEYFKNYFHKVNNNLFILNKDDSYVENFGKQWRRVDKMLFMLGNLLA